MEKIQPQQKISDSISITCDLIKCDKFFDNDTESRNIYLVQVEHDGKKISFEFGDSVYDTNMGNEPTKHDILTCITADSYCPANFEEFCVEFEYDQDSISALKTFKKCKNQSKKIASLFSESEIEALRNEGFE